MLNPRYIVGIDLGTTNTVVAWTETNAEERANRGIRVFPVPQLVEPGSVLEKPSLPSFVLLPGPNDVSPEALAVPWTGEKKWAVGTFARDRGAEIPHRLVSSSKSWLCNPHVDRNRAVLPWEAPEDGTKISPVEASSLILRHIRDTWNHGMAGGDDSLKLENQEIYLTVPASFDAVARDLTVQAAVMAGLGSAVLLEEPQAAFYAWIESGGETWRETVRVGDLVLVVDIGGGTTDFSLIEVSEKEGGLQLERIAVGEHVLLGGDNMDLTLAYGVASRMKARGQKLNAYQVRGLSHGCRLAKEHLLSDERAESFPVTVLGRGSSVIGGTIRTALERRDVEETLVEGFFPPCGRDEDIRREKSAGMRELGLSYTADPAVTRHMARFISRQCRSGSGDPLFPTAVLFNGGVMKSAVLRSRVLDILSAWAKESGSGPVREIPGRDFDLSVARGAAYYGLVRRGKGIRIRSGLSRSYYLGVETAMPAVPGMPRPMKALCVAPLGMEEGTEADIPGQEFGLIVGEPVTFDFLGSLDRHEDRPGTVVEDWEGEIEEITTVETRLEGEAGAVIPVTLQVRVTEIGTLELWCVSREDGRKYRLEFSVREQESDG
ncbi:MAG TPA: Hsp70 family protein [Syntrophales bacterium]|nr:Hsp70 family protein [Syntrophales bacterium]